MGLFNQRAAGLCWDSGGRCFGVLVSREGHKYKVLKSWTQQVSNPDAIADALLQGTKNLGIKEEDLLVAGSFQYLVGHWS